LIDGRKPLSANTPSDRPAPLTPDFEKPAPADPDLARVVEAWRHLPEPIRRDVLALIASAGS
jgi:hypothetical protein